MNVPNHSLIEHVPPPANPVENQGDWAQVELQLGTSLPDDYKWFISVYGTGAICDDYIRVLNPFTKIGVLDLLKCYRGTLDRYRVAKKEGETPIVPYPVYPEPGGILPWGTSANGHEMSWLTIGEPNNWGIVFSDRNRIECRKYEQVCMSEFLVTVLKGQMDGGAFKVPEFFLEDQPRFRTPNDFVNAKHRKERWKQWNAKNETGKESS